MTTVICRRTDGRLMKELLPWVVEEAFCPIIKQKLNAKLSTKGDALIITTTSQEQTNAVTSVTKIQDHEVYYSSPTVQCQGSIWAPELDCHEADALLEGFASQGVSAVYRPPRGPRAILILTFPTADPPKRVTAGYLSYQVRLVIPKPRRCDNCQGYGHSRKRCRSTVSICGKCSDTGHSAQECPNEVKCPACDGQHEVTSRQCPAWHYYYRINELIYGDKKDPREARQIAKAEFGIMATAPRRRLSEDPPSPDDRDHFPNLQTDDNLTSTEHTPTRLSGQGPTRPTRPDTTRPTGPDTTRPTGPGTAQKRSLPKGDRGSATRCNEASSDEEGEGGPWTQGGTKPKSKSQRSKDRETSPPRPRGCHGVVNLPTIERSASVPCEPRGRRSVRGTESSNAFHQETPARRTTRGANQTQNKHK